ITYSTSSFAFFFHAPPTTEIYTLSLHDALPISKSVERWTTSWSSSWNEPGSKSSAMRSRAVSLPSLCWRWMRASPPPSSLSRLRSEEHTSELQSRGHLVCRLLLEKKKTKRNRQ